MSSLQGDADLAADAAGRQPEGSCCDVWQWAKGEDAAIEGRGTRLCLCERVSSTHGRDEREARERGDTMGMWGVLVEGVCAVCGGRSVDRTAE